MSNKTLLLTGTQGRSGVAAPIVYDATFAGDATGVTNQTSALQTFLNANTSNKTIALAPNGIYRVLMPSPQSAILSWNNASGCRIDFRGAKLLVQDNAVLRSGADLSATTGSGVVTSATAAFTAADVGRVLTITGVPYSIQTFTSATQVTIVASVGLSTSYAGTTGGSKAWTIAEHAAHGVLRLNDCVNMTLNDVWVQGERGAAGFVWVDASQYEAGVMTSGGNNITVNRPRVYYTMGDGLYAVPSAAFNNPVVNFNNIDVHHNARNSVSPIGGTVTIDGGTTDYSGLHGIDFEPNGTTYNGLIDAASITGVVRNLSIFGYAQLAVENAECAVAAGGSNAAMKPSVSVINCIGVYLLIYIRNAVNAIVQLNQSATPVDYYYGTSSPPFYLNTNTTFSNNNNITQHSVSDWSPDISPGQTR